MKFCNSCGGRVEIKTPEIDDHQRFVCTICGTKHYQNPKIVVGCLPVWQDSVLLCKRAIEPRSGYWTVHAGFMELDETVTQGAVRETWEEARAKVELLAPYCMFNLRYVNQLYIIYRARLVDLNFSPGPESMDVRLFREADIPWEHLAFTAVHQTLSFFFKDRSRGRFPMRSGTIVPQKAGFRYEAGPDDQLANVS